MYRVLFRTLNAARNSSVHLHDLSLISPKCDKAAASVNRAAYGSGVKSLSTSSALHSEKKDDADPPYQEEKITETVLTQKVEDDSTVTETAEQNKEPSMLKTDKGNVEKKQMDVKVEEVATTSSDGVKAPVVKSGKEGLLDLLGAMKVEVTNKRKLKSFTLVNQITEFTPKPKPEAMESTISMFQKATVEAASQSGALDPKLVAAASAAASTLPNSSQAESELLKQLRGNKAITNTQRRGDGNNLGGIIADMKVGKRFNRQNVSPASQIRFDDDGKGFKPERGITSELDGLRRRRSLLSGRRLNIFSPTSDEDAVETTVARPTLWDMDFSNQLVTSTNQHPRNGFEEMIQWTKEGKMWQYPINNEAGLDEEAAVSFHEHIFLSQHLEEGFPQQGPVRHFMELVVAGLSRNPYLTVQQKKDHISWFRDYFHQKEEILKDADVYLN